jgi:RNase P subunit RPR2
MNCPKCHGFLITEIDYEYTVAFNIYQQHCINCGYMCFDPRTVDKTPYQLTKEAV